MPSDQQRNTHLSSGRLATRDGGRLSDMLMVTTAVRMLHGVHADTAHRRPRVALGAVLVEGAARLHDGLVGTAAARDDAWAPEEAGQLAGRATVRRHRATSGMSVTASWSIV